MRREPDGLTRATVAAVLSVTFLILIGYAILLFVRPTDLDRKCLSEPLRTIGACIQDYYDKRGN